MEEEKEKENFPLCESIGHRPLRDRCPAPTLDYNLPKQSMGTADHLTLLRLSFVYISNISSYVYLSFKYEFPHISKSSDTHNSFRVNV